MRSARIDPAAKHGQYLSGERQIVEHLTSLDCLRVADPQNQARKAYDAERRHAEARSEEDATKTAAGVDGQQAAADRDHGADEGAGDRPLHSARALTGAIERISQAKEPEEWTRRTKVVCAGGEDDRVSAEDAEPQ